MQLGPKMAEFLARVQEANRAKPATQFRQASKAPHLLGQDLLETLLAWGDKDLVNFACKKRRQGATIAEISADVHHALTWIRKELRAGDFDPASVCATLLNAIKFSWRNKRDAHTQQERDSAQSKVGTAGTIIVDEDATLHSDDDGEVVTRRIDVADAGSHQHTQTRDSQLRAIDAKEADARRAFAERRIDSAQLQASITHYDNKRAEIRAAFASQAISSRGNAGGHEDPQPAGTRVHGETTHTPAIEVGEFQLRIAQ